MPTTIGRYRGGPAAARRRLSPGHRLALADGAFPQAGCAGARRRENAGWQGGTKRARAGWRPLYRHLDEGGLTMCRRSPTAMRPTAPPARPSRRGPWANCCAWTPCCRTPCRAPPQESSKFTLPPVARTCHVAVVCRPFIETAEGQRLAQADSTPVAALGPYLSERQWGTVREDYSAFGTAWDYFPHDRAQPRLSLGRGRHRRLRRRPPALVPVLMALWNGRDPHHQGHT